MLNQGAQSGSESPTPVGAAEAPAPTQSHPAHLQWWSPPELWAALTAPAGTPSASDARLGVELLPIVAPAPLCAIALLIAQGAHVHWLVAGSALFSALFALAGVAALFWSRHTPVEQAPLRAAATTLGGAWMAVAALCALPLLLSGMSSALLALALGGVAFLLFGIGPVRPRIAPLDEALTPLCLGPGLFALTIVAQGQRFTRADWLVAGALGGMAFAVIVGLRMRAAVAADDQDTRADRSLATIFGARVAGALIAVALLASYALVVAIAVPRGGWPGALLALTSAPLALIGFSGLAVSSYLPARQSAARQLVRAYLWFGLALAVGLALTLVTQQIIQAMTRTLGG